MMISCPYMVFRIRYNVSDWVTYRDGESYLFYDTVQRQLYELPRVYTRAEIIDQQNHPIRYLSQATPLGPQITIQNPYDFAHDKEVRSIIKEKHPRMLQLYGMGRALIVSHERDEINYHMPHWSERAIWNEGCMRREERPGLTGWGRQVRAPRENYSTVNKKLEVTEDISERGWRNENLMVPQSWRKRQVYEFRTIRLFRSLHHEPYFMITEIQLENNGRSKKGRLSYWNWCNHWGTKVLELTNHPIRVEIDKINNDHGICYVNDEAQRTPWELLDTLNYNLSVPLAQVH